MSGQSAPFCTSLACYKFAVSAGLSCSRLPEDWFVLAAGLRSLPERQSRNAFIQIGAVMGLGSCSIIRYRSQIEGQALPFFTRCDADSPKLKSS